MSMKTLHIKNYMNVLPDGAVTIEDAQKSQDLIKDLYDKFLKDDPKFHFFFEPELIIRISSTDCLCKVKSYLNQNDIEFVEYDYPFPLDGKYGETENGIVARNFDLFVTIFHTNAISALTMDEEDFFDYIERVIHTAFNPRFMSHEQEGASLLRLAELKLGSDELKEILSRMR